MRLAAALFVADPQLPRTNTPNGAFNWIQVVGLVDRADMNGLRSAPDAERGQVGERVRGAEGLWITRPDRLPIVMT